jgi:outer membrane protein assembly factor BamB
MRHRDTGVLFHDEARATAGYTLIVPLVGRAAYLIGMRGEILHQWTFPLTPGNYAYLMDNGNLLWSGRTEEGPPLRRGKGGLLREYDWHGKVVWEHTDHGQHHDFRRCPNGNTIYLGWEPLPEDAAKRVRGGRPGTEKNGVVNGDYLREVDPTGRTVWEWHFHLDEAIEEHPLIPSVDRQEFAHANACFPMSNGDVMVSFRRINTIAIVDRKTRKFRWRKRDDMWGTTHDAHMLPNGNILFFANGIYTPLNPFSRVVELDPETGKEVWEYRGRPTWTFFSPNISGAQRLSSGNTLICEGQMGRVFEVTPDGDIVWEYISPFFGPYDWFGLERGGVGNSIFRAYRYAGDSAEIAGRVRSPYYS